MTASLQNDKVRIADQRTSHASVAVLLFFPGAFLVGWAISGDWVGAFRGLIYATLGFVCFTVPGIYADSRQSYLRKSIMLYLTAFAVLTSLYLGFFAPRLDWDLRLHGGQFTIGRVLASLVNQAPYVVLYISIVIIAWWWKDHRARRRRASELPG